MPNNKLGADPKKEFCSNPKCCDYGKMGMGTIVRYGRDKNGKPRFKCKSCEGVFVETKNTIFYNRKLSEDQIIMICKLLVEKNGIRAIERIMEIHRDTVSDVIALVSALYRLQPKRTHQFSGRHKKQRIAPFFLVFAM